MEKKKEKKKKEKKEKEEKEEKKEKEKETKKARVRSVPIGSDNHPTTRPPSQTISVS